MAQYTTGHTSAKLERLQRCWLQPLSAPRVLTESRPPPGDRDIPIVSAHGLPPGQACADPEIPEVRIVARSDDHFNQQQSSGWSNRATAHLENGHAPIVIPIVDNLRQ